MASNYRICSNCVMDTTDPDITFDARGFCDHCHEFELKVRPLLKMDPTSKQELFLEKINEIKISGKGKEYDCIVGLSGGVDSSYVAHVAKQQGLRPLAVHFDSGWNSELAVSNIEGIVKKLGFDLVTIVCNWEEMKDLQLSFFKAGVSNCDIPQDHAFVAALFQVAKKHKIKHILSGHNIATESCLPMAWGYTSRDLKHLKAIHRQFGTVQLQDFPTYTLFDDLVGSRFLHKQTKINILDYLDYNKDAAKALLIDQFGWRDYGGKHYESKFTRFFQSYYLPVKFNYDKRRAHLSSLILSEQIEREEAIAILSKPSFDPREAEEDKLFVAKKLDISSQELESIINGPRHYSEEYPHSIIISLARKVRHLGWKSALKSNLFRKKSYENSKDSKLSVPHGA